MIYTILLNGGGEIEVDHGSTPQQLESVIKGLQGSSSWVKFITPDGDWFLDSLAIQGYRPHDASTITFGGTPETPEDTGPAIRPPKKRKA